MDWFESIFRLLDPLLPEPIGELIIWAIVVLGALITVFLSLRRIVLRKTMFIRSFSEHVGDAPIDRSRFAKRLTKQMKEIRSAHKESALKGSGEAMDLSTPRRLTENVGSRVGAFLVNRSPVGLLLTAAGWVWPRLELAGTAGVKGSTLRCDCYLTGVPPGARIWERDRKPLVPFHVEVGCNGPDPELGLSEKLAYRIVMDVPQLPIPQTQDRISLGTTTWEAFKAHTEALRLWQGPDFKIDLPEQVKKVGAKLNDSIGNDSEYALAHYNLAVLTYLRHESPETNQLARTYFLEAARLARESGDKPTRGLAWVGVSRCYSQDRHRYGRMEAEVVNKARYAASYAVELLPHDPRTLYASAFAWHCTETLDDIRKGRPGYEEIIRKYPDKYIAVYNNLGYILMVGGELLQAQGNPEEAKDWWKQAERNMKKAIALSKVHHRMANANLGNLQRLRNDYQGALDYYREALGGDPETSEYTNGLNELARLYFDMGLSNSSAPEAKANHMTQGLHHHQHALRSTTGDHKQLQKLMCDVIDIRKKDHLAAAKIASLYQKTSKPEKPADIETWLAELARFLETAVVSPPN